MLHGFWKLTWVETKVFLREPMGVFATLGVPVGSLTDEQARTMLQDYLKAKEDHLKVRKSYVKRFEKVLPASS